MEDDVEETSYMYVHSKGGKQYNRNSNEIQSSYYVVHVPQ